MKHYKVPKWSKRIFPSAIWDFYFKPENNLYLTFDDGPHPLTSPWLIDFLKENQIKATFFCTGQNALKYPELIESLKADGHIIGNHSMTHPKGWKTDNKAYIEDVLEAKKVIESNLFRPPYGKIKFKQYRALKEKGFQMVFWSVMAFDFDLSIPSVQRLDSIKKHSQPGSIIVFHDSEKAFPQLKMELPLLIEEWKTKGYKFAQIEEN